VPSHLTPNAPVAPQDIVAEQTRRGWVSLRLHGITFRADGTPACRCSEGANCPAQGKHPSTKGWQTSTRDTRIFPTPTDNIGVLTGTPSGIWVLDIDDHDAWSSWLAGRVLPDTYTVSTPRGGMHHYWLLPDGFVVTNANRLPTGVDTRGEGGQAVAAGSHGALGDYVVISDAPVARAPEWLLETVRPLSRSLTTPGGNGDYTAGRGADAVARYVLAALRRSVDEFRGTPEGGRNAALFRGAVSVAGLLHLGVAGMGEDDLRREFTSAAEDIGLSRWEIDRTLTSAIGKGMGNPRALPAMTTGSSLPKETAGGAPSGDIDRPTDGVSTTQVIAVPPVTDDVGSTDAIDVLAEPAPDAAVALAVAAVAPVAPTTPQGPQGRAWTDVGNARRIDDRHGAQIRWVNEAAKWVVYEAGAWRLDSTGIAETLAQDVLEHLVDDEGALYTDPEERDAFVKWARGQQATARVTAALTAAQRLRPLIARLAEFDVDPMLLNVTNGVIDLTTGELLPHDPDLMLMEQAAVAYDPDAVCPQWDTFLGRTMPDPDMRSYLQRITGYSCSADIGEQALFLHYGEGANGKSVYLETIGEVLGTYSQVVPADSLMKRDSSGVPNDIARMMGKRFLQASETEDGKRLDEERVKSLTGGEKVTARFMRAEFFDFKPTGNIHLVTNNKPMLSQAASIWRRLHHLGWDVTIPADEQVLGLAGIMVRDEGPGILAWIVRGALAWQREGLAAPQSARDRLEEYRADQDVIGRFMEDRLLWGDDARDLSGLPIQTTGKVLYETYRRWCEEVGHHPLAQHKLTTALEKHGLTKPTRTRTGAVWSGVALAEDQAHRPQWPKTPYRDPLLDG
jgi:putative DNA primase/helicase